jgi:tRNA (Thr-GGU) A37 N-methylase
MTVVKFLRREDNILYVEGLDALDGTPVVDIKPYLPHGDAVPNASVATWIAKGS